MRVLVVTDKYPPRVVGGAEISLHLTLQALAGRQFEIEVAVLDGHKESTPEKDSADGLTIWHLPEIGQWPRQYPYPEPGQPALRGLGGRLAWPVAAARYLGEDNRTLTQRWRRLQDFRTVSKGGAGNWLPSFDDDLVPPSGTVSALRTLIGQFEPDLIHADNYRSIMVASQARPPETRLVSMVRDNRFFCARRDQDTNIDGDICTGCAFECVKALPASVAGHAESVMREVLEFRRACLSSSDAVITTSAYLADQQSALGLDRPISVAGNPAGDSAWVDRIQTSIRQASPPEILVVGMVNANKGQASIVDWILRLKEQVDDFRFVLAGRGALMNRLRRMAAEAGVSDHLLTPGFLGREELYRAYARSTIVLAPSVWPEPFGRVPLEAGLSHRPVIAYNVGGLGESIIDGETGYVVPSGDEDLLLNRAVALLRDPELAARLGSAARQHIETAYSRDQVAAAVARVWQTAISGER